MSEPAPPNIPERFRRPTAPPTPPEPSLLTRLGLRPGGPGVRVAATLIDAAISAGPVMALLYAYDFPSVLVAGAFRDHLPAPWGTFLYQWLAAAVGQPYYIVAAGAALPWAIRAEDGAAAPPALLIVAFAWLIAYAPLMVWATNGRTLGKWVFGLRAIRADRRPFGPAQALWRETACKGLFAGLAAILCGLGAVGNFFCMLWTDDNRAGHDLLADTAVIRE